MKYRQPRRGLLAILLIILISASGFAEQYQGTVKFGGVAVPGAVVTAAQNDKKVTTVTDDQGRLHVSRSGHWRVDPSNRDVGVCQAKSGRGDHLAGSGAGVWELKMMSMADCCRSAASAPVATVPAASGSPKPAGAAVAPASNVTPRISNSLGSGGPGRFSTNQCECSEDRCGGRCQ